MPLLIPRRRLLAAGAGLAMGGLLGGRGVGAVTVATPQQTEGPFYPVALPADTDYDLVRVAGTAAHAQGTVTHVAGRVTTLDGRPVPGARVEIWQCDAHGVYLHPRSDGAGRRDAGFQGFGATTTAADGSYRFRTIRPVPYPGRTPHIHFAVVAPGRPRLVTQMYVAGEAGNARDTILRRLSPAEREAVVVALAPADAVEPGALAGRFDIVLA